MCLQQRGELVGGGDPRLHQVVAGADHGAQCPGLAGVRHRGGQLVVAQPQVLGDHGGVPGVGLGSRQHLPVPPGLDRVRLDRHHRVPGFQQQVHQPPVRPLDGDGQVTRVTEPGRAADQRGDPVRGVLDGELSYDLAPGIHHAHSMRGGGPVDPGEELCVRQRKRQLDSLQRQRRPGEEDNYRVVTNRRSAALLPVASPCPRENRGRQCHPGRRTATATGRHPGSPPSPFSKHRSGTHEKDGALVTAMSLAGCLSAAAETASPGGGLG
ncbi:MAG TPA: hypothetical protein VGH53_07975 [Streptosporangiaceae bacterium]